MPNTTKPQIWEQLLCHLEGGLPACSGITALTSDLDHIRNKHILLRWHLPLQSHPSSPVNWSIIAVPLMLLYLITRVPYIPLIRGLPWTCTNNENASKIMIRSDNLRGCTIALTGQACTWLCVTWSTHSNSWKHHEGNAQPCHVLDRRLEKHCGEATRIPNLIPAGIAARSYIDHLIQLVRYTWWWWWWWVFTVKRPARQGLSIRQYHELKLHARCTIAKEWDDNRAKQADAVLLHWHAHVEVVEVCQITVSFSIHVHERMHAYVQHGTL